MKKILFALGLWLSAWPATAELFKTDEFTLDNGLQVVVIENHKAPLIKHMVWYKVGSVDEFRGKGGIAHLLEHLMFRGTKLLKNSGFNDVADELGAEHNAFTSFDVTVYHQLVDISKLEALMAMEADRMQNLAFDEDAFIAEQKIVYQERQQVIENNPAAAFNERFNLLLWGNLAYGQPITGQNAEIMALTYNDARDFYERFYAPNNAILILSGDIDSKTAKILAQKYYGSIPAKTVERVAAALNEDKFQTSLTMALPDIQAVKIVQKFLLPNYQKLEEPYLAYLVLAEYLGGDETSALYQDLVVEQQVALSVSADYHFLSRSNGVFSFSMRPTENDDTFDKKQYLEILQDALTQAMHNLTDAELEKVKRKMTADLVYVNDNPEDAAYWVGYMLSVGFTLEDVQSYAANIKNVSLDDIFKAYRQIMSAPKVDGFLLPQKMQEENDE